MAMSPRQAAGLIELQPTSTDGSVQGFSTPKAESAAARRIRARAWVAANAQRRDIGSVNYAVLSPLAQHRFVVGGAQVASISAAGITVGPEGAPSWSWGEARPTAIAPVGSLYSCTRGVPGATLYLSRGAGKWAAVA